MVMVQRGDIFWVNLDPTLGSEIKKKRPAIIVSNNAANKRYHQVTVLPLTSQKTTAVETFQVFLSQEETGLNKDSKALAEQIRTVSKLRLGSRLGHVHDELMNQIDRAICVHLGIE